MYIILLWLDVVITGNCMVSIYNSFAEKHENIHTLRLVKSYYVIYVNKKKNDTYIYFRIFLQHSHKGKLRTQHLQFFYRVR